MTHSATFNHRTGLEIAIIGMSGRFPGAENIEMFWRNLKDGIESISFFSDKELLASGISIDTLRHQNYVKAKGLLEDIECFDASFFGLTPREAQIMDPQHRVFLEEAWKALESTGYDTERYEGAIGVYAGVGMSTYFLVNLSKNPDLVKSMGGLPIVIANDKDYLPTRVSYHLNLKGPSIAVQTACSTSLVAVHLACRGLLSGECDIALAGGVSIGIPQKEGYLYQEGGIDSPDGHCRAFDAKAQGTLGSSGVGIVVLKRLDDAIADGDGIDALILGSAVNNDGSFKAGYTAPGVDGQAKVIQAAQTMAEVSPESITYIETHGTATAFGDPIEILALTNAFRTRTSKKGFCAIGSVKTNIGHTDEAAGVAGLIKTSLALKHRLIPPSLHFEVPNPRIDFASSPFYVNTRLTEWEEGEVPRRAGVSSFGIGGTNAHVVLGEAPQRESSSESRAAQLLVISAKTSTALEMATENLVNCLKRNVPSLNLADIAYTLAVGRKVLNNRRMLVCQNLSDALTTLETLDARRVSTVFQEPGDRPVIFMFPGQGTQYLQMGAELYSEEPTFRESIDYCAEYLRPHLGLDLRTVLYPSKQDIEEANRQLRQTSIAQPALFTIEYALANLWMTWGIHPRAMIGHSIGEYVAACLAKVFSLEEALALVTARGKLMQELPPGKMLAVDLSAEALQALLDQHVSLASINAPSRCVAAGSTDAIDKLETQLTQKGVTSRPIYTSHAFHSEMMEPIRDSFMQLVQKVKLKTPQIPYVSNVTGTWIKSQEAMDANYWVRHLRETVRFADGVTLLLKNPDQILLEVGPGATLTTLVRQQPDLTDRYLALSSLPPLREQHPDLVFLLNTLGQLWLAGVEIDWFSFYAHEKRHRLPLPTYPFERQKYWVSPPSTASDIETQEHSETFKEGQLALCEKTDIADWFYVPVWKQSISQFQFESLEKSRQQLCWLIFIDVYGVGTDIAKRLSQEGQKVIIVMTGEKFHKVRDRVYAINPRQRVDYEALLSELQGLNLPIQQIVHLWSIRPLDRVQSELGGSEQDLFLDFYSLLFLAQVLGSQVIAPELGTGKMRDSRKITIVSNNMQQVTGKDILCPEKATLLGPCRVIPQEYPNVICQCIDIMLPEFGPQQKEELINQLLAEFWAESSDAVIAYRGHHRWVQTFESLRLADHAGCPPRLREGGVYLITGGLGGIGLELAEYLAQTLQAKLTLIGRSAFPPREQWEEWLAVHDEKDEVSQKIWKLQGLEKLGAEILVESVDVTNEKQMQTVTNKICRRFGKIHGVIHAAGIPPDSLIQRKTPETAMDTLAPKVKGAQVLDSIFKGVGLDFLVLCSSLRSIIGGPGGIDYSAANAFLDAFAHCRNSIDSMTVSINWDSWREVGMTVNTPRRLDSKSEEKIEGMSSKEGVEVFRRILHGPFPQIIVSMRDLQAVTDHIDAIAKKSIEELDHVPFAIPSHPRPQLGNPYTAPRNDVEQILVDIWGQLLGIESIGIFDNFFELGGDSVISIQIIARANQTGLRLTPKQVFEHQTVAALAEAAGTAQAIQVEQTVVTGPVPLIPIQCWFFEQDFAEKHHFNQSVLLDVPGFLDVALLEQAVHQLLIHHDALRIHFIQRESSSDGDPTSKSQNWQQICPGLDCVVPVTQIDFSALKATAQVDAIVSTTAELQTSMNLLEAPLVRVAHFDLGADRSHRLLIVIHHLVIDAISWRVLLADLQTGYQQLKHGEIIELPKKTTSFQRWAKQLTEYAQSEILKQELDYWLTELKLPVLPLPVNKPGGINSVASVRSVSVSLRAEETRVLLQEVPKVYNSQINDVLLTALTQGFTQWTGQRSLYVDLEGHGRDAIFDDVDLSRTVGWFTTLFPIQLSLSDNSHPEESLESIKEQLRRIPNGGIGYGLLRYLNREKEIAQKLRALPHAEVNFLYLGQFDQSLSESSPFQLAKEASGRSQSMQGLRSYLLELNGGVIDSKLQMTFLYSKNVHQRSTVERLAQGFIEALRELIAHCQSSEVGDYTPSDFPEAGLNKKELDEIIAELKELEDDDDPN